MGTIGTHKIFTIILLVIFNIFWGPIYGLYFSELEEEFSMLQNIEPGTEEDEIELEEINGNSEENKKALCEEFFPIEKLPTELIIFIASLLLKSENAENSCTNIYADIASFLITCKKFYALKNNINKLVIENLDGHNYKLLSARLELIKKDKSRSGFGTRGR